MTSFKLCFKGYALMNKLKRASCKMELAKSELEAMAASYPGGMYDYVSLSSSRMELNILSNSNAAHLITFKFLSRKNCLLK